MGGLAVARQVAAIQGAVRQLLLRNHLLRQRGDPRTWLRDEQAEHAIVNRVERIMRRAPRVHQRTANDGRKRAATVTWTAEQVEQREPLGLVRDL